VEAGFMAFHAFHTLSFPWPAFKGADQNSMFPKSPFMKNYVSPGVLAIDTIWMPYPKFLGCRQK
jgi:hypothetical protein